MPDSRRLSPSNGRTVLLFLLVFAAALAGGLVARIFPIGSESGSTQNVSSASLPASLSPLVRRTAPAVVNIAVLQPSPADQNPLLRDPFFRRYLGVPDSALEPAISAGSGVIVDAKRGLVITNFHVIRDATAVEVGLRDKRQFPAELVGASPDVDVAVLRIRGSNLPELPLGDSSKLSVGDYVVAIGNPFGLGQTVTAGIVSATDRSIGRDDERRLIQTDAPINPGNSGGPLIDSKGEVIGINSALVSPTEGNVGIGFAVPSNVAREVLRSAAR